MVAKSNRLMPNEIRLLTGLADLLKRAREERGLSERELAKRADMSRQHVRFAMAGGNLSIAYLLRITRALEIPSRALSGLGLHVLVALRHVDDAYEHLSEAAALLTGEAAEGVHAPEKDDNTDAEAAALVREVTANAKKLSPDRLAALDETLRGLVASAEQPRVSPSKQRRSGAGWRAKK
jgi:transcriptional regulator with XRE-family HTH domain